MKAFGFTNFFVQLAVFAVLLLDTSALPHPSEDIVLVEEIVRLSATNAMQNNTSATLITLTESSSEDGSSSSDSDSGEDNHSSDDLIFLAHKGLKQQESEHQIDLITSDEEDSLTARDSRESQELETPVNAMVATPIDMRAFVALIPMREVKTIANNYYRHDAEVQRAYAFLNSSHFGQMKQQLMQLPEVLALTRYLNSSGLDVVKTLQSVTHAISPPALLQTAQELSAGNEIVAPTPASEASKDAFESSTKEQLNGLHGLVDSILDVLPQDQILATFFDMLEADEQFSRLVDSIGTSAFAKILSKLQNSVPLRNLIFVLHNNGIYIARIVESLKSYFFLASF